MERAVENDRNSIFVLADSQSADHTGNLHIRTADHRRRDCVHLPPSGIQSENRMENLAMRSVRMCIFAGSDTGNPESKLDCCRNYSGTQEALPTCNCMFGCSAPASGSAGNLRQPLPPEPLLSGRKREHTQCTVSMKLWHRASQTAPW